MSEKTTEEWTATGLGVYRPGWLMPAFRCEYPEFASYAAKLLQNRDEEIRALTRERDEAVREAAELRALAEKMAPHIIAFRTMTDVFHGAIHSSHPIAKVSECSMCYLRAEVDAKLDSLTTDKAAQE